MKIEETDKLILFFDSAKSEIKRSNDDFTVTIKNNPLRCNKNEYLEVELTECTIRRDFPSVANYNRHFDIYYNGANAHYDLDIGFPNAITIDQQIKQDFENEFSIANGWTHDEVFTVSFSNYTGKITISSSFQGTPPSDLALNSNVPNSSHEIIGFSPKASYPFTINGQNVTLTSPRSINVIGEQDIYIRSSLASGKNYEMDSDNLISTDIIGKMPILGPPFSNLNFFNTSSLFRSRLNSSSLGSFDLRFTNENNELIGSQSNITGILTFRKYRLIQDEQLKTLNDILRLERLKLLKNNLS